MIIDLNESSGSPAYQQVYTQIKRLILNGELKSNEIIPSIRSLAKQCSCSVITIRKGYEKLENDGLIYSKPGKGSFVAKLEKDQIAKSKKDQVFRAIDEMIIVSDNLGVDREDLPNLVKERIKDGK